MKYSEVHKDLFTVSDDYYLAHCCASDLRLGAGIAVPMQKKFNLRGKIMSSGKSLNHPTCILTGRVFNLITKKRSSGKPSHESLGIALIDMRDIALEEGITKIAMPKIGCGLDKLSWPMVRRTINDVFQSTSIEILVCVWR